MPYKKKKVNKCIQWIFFLFGFSELEQKEFFEKHYNNLGFLSLFFLKTGKCLVDIM